MGIKIDTVYNMDCLELMRKMKKVLVSTRPQWCEKIVSGEKTIEVRKSAPQEVPFKCYIYCTSGKSPNVLLKDKNNCFGFGDYRNDGDGFDIANGKVIGEFICNEVDEYGYHNLPQFNSIGLPCGSYNSYIILKSDYEEMCLSYDEVKEYGEGKTLYGWHISDLKIYDKPRELSEFYRNCEKPKCEDCPYFYVVNTPNSVETYCEVNEKIPITRPTQSWCYVEESEKND